HIARGKECLEEKVAIVITSRSISRLRKLRGQVKGRRTVVAGKSGIIHPDKTNHPERHCAHRLKRAESDAADEKAGGALAAREGLLKVRENHIERDGFVKAGKLSGLA